VLNWSTDWKDSESPVDTDVTASVFTCKSCPKYVIFYSIILICYTYVSSYLGTFSRLHTTGISRRRVAVVMLCDVI